MKERLGVVDGLRGIAVMQVVFFHVWLFGRLPAPGSWLAIIPRTGFWGMYLLFFISGFVLVYPFAYARYTGEPEQTWRHFAWRRFIKIMPSYWLCIAVAYAVGFAAFERTPGTTVLQELSTHALFIHTWWTNTAGAINGPLWTMAIDVSFYAIFPLLWWCFKRAPWVTGLGLIATAPAYRSWHGPHLPSGNLPSYIDLFAFGMLTAWSFVHFGPRLRDGRARHLALVLTTTGVAILVLTGELYMKVPAGWARGDLREAFGLACSLLVLGALCSRGWTLALSNPLLRFLAICSYNIYLWNWMLIHYLQRFHLGQMAFTVTSLVIAVALGALVTYVFERPLLRLPDPGLVSTRLQPATSEA